MKKILNISVFIGVLAAQVAACQVCRIQAQNGIYDQNFFSNLFVVLLPIFILLAAGLSVYFSGNLPFVFKGGVDEKR